MNRSIQQFFICVLTLSHCCICVAENKINEQTISKINTYLEQSIEHGFSGAVLVSEKDNILLNKGYGLADRKQRIPNTHDTVFDIGSNSKQFTGAAILVLVQQNKLKLSDSLIQFFDAVPQDKKNITVHHLLAHTAGLVESVGRDFEHISEDDFFDQVFSSPLKHPVGSQYAYSNVGYSLLAKIIEKVSSTEYETILTNPFI